MSHSASALFGTCILIGFCGSIPQELDEAALVDGAKHFQMLFEKFIPAPMPGWLAISRARFLYAPAFFSRLGKDPWRGK